MAVYRFIYAASRIRKYFTSIFRKLLPERVARARTDQLIGSETISLLLSDLSAIPPIRIPPGYHSATLSPGHEMDYVRVMRQSLAAEADMEWFCRTFSDAPDYTADNLLLIYKDTRPIAAAAAWQALSEGKKTGLVHMLGVDRNYQGRGLGRVMLLLVLHRLKERGFHSVIAAAEDVRIPAISLYLSLGFKPHYRNRLDELRWRKVLSRIPAEPGN
jgi:ribosomal protein S18 acetylase RimI-like enzyme